jgi:hypothetical protein
MKWMHDEGTRNMLADIAKADPFDGGCVADVTADAAHGGKGGTMGDAAAALPVTRGNGGVADYELLTQIQDDGHINRAYYTGRERGLMDARAWLRANGWREAADALFMSHEQVVAQFDK